MKKYLLLLLMILPSIAFAMGEQYGRISGIVYDPTGAELAGAKVVLNSPVLTKGPRTVYSSTDGSFTFHTLSPGSYELSVSNNGMRPYTYTNIQVAVGKTASMYVAMGYGTEPIVVGPSALPDFTVFCSYPFDPEKYHYVATFLPGLRQEEPFVLWADIDLQPIPKKGQSLEAFVVVLPSVSENNGTLLISGRPAQLIDNNRLALPPMKSPAQR